jgi:plasmid stabilization system protein ParE
MRIRILTEASKDLIRGKSFYEAQQVGLGDYFFDSISSDVESLLLHAGIHRKVRGYHCLLSKRFPFAVYYRTEREEIRIYRILDCRRDPVKIDDALG